MSALRRNEQQSTSKSKQQGNRSPNDTSVSQWPLPRVDGTHNTAAQPLIRRIMRSRTDHLPLRTAIQRRWTVHPLQRQWPQLHYVQRRRRAEEAAEGSPTVAVVAPVDHTVTVKRTQPTASRHPGSAQPPVQRVSYWQSTHRDQLLAVGNITPSPVALNHPVTSAATAVRSTAAERAVATAPTLVVNAGHTPIQRRATPMDFHQLANRVSGHVAMPLVSTGSRNGGRMGAGHGAQRTVQRQPTGSNQLGSRPLTVRTPSSVINAQPGNGGLGEFRVPGVAQPLPTGTTIQRLENPASPQRLMEQRATASATQSISGTAGAQRGRRTAAESTDSTAVQRSFASSDSAPHRPHPPLASPVAHAAGRGPIRLIQPASSSATPLAGVIQRQAVITDRPSATYGSGHARPTHHSGTTAFHEPVVAAPSYGAPQPPQRSVTTTTTLQPKATVQSAANLAGATPSITQTLRRRTEEEIVRRQPTGPSTAAIRQTLRYVRQPSASSSTGASSAATPERTSIRRRSDPATARSFNQDPSTATGASEPAAVRVAATPTTSTQAHQGELPPVRHSTVQRSTVAPGSDIVSATVRQSVPDVTTASTVVPQPAASVTTASTTAQRASLPVVKPSGSQSTSTEGLAGRAEAVASGPSGTSSVPVHPMRSPQSPLQRTAARSAQEVAEQSVTTASDRAMAVVQLASTAQQARPMSRLSLAQGIANPDSSNAGNSGKGASAVESPMGSGNPPSLLPSARATGVEAGNVASSALSSQIVQRASYRPVAGAKLANILTSRAPSTPQPVQRFSRQQSGIPANTIMRTPTQKGNGQRQESSSRLTKPRLVTRSAVQQRASVQGAVEGTVVPGNGSAVQRAQMSTVSMPEPATPIVVASGVRQAGSPYGAAGNSSGQLRTSGGTNAGARSGVSTLQLQGVQRAGRAYTPPIARSNRSVTAVQPARTGHGLQNNSPGDGQMMTHNPTPVPNGSEAGHDLALPLVQRSQSNGQGATDGATANANGAQHFTMLESSASAMIQRAVEEQMMDAAPLLNGHLQRAPSAAISSPALRSMNAGAANGGATNSSAQGVAISEMELTRVANEVYNIIEQRLTLEREALGY